MQVVIHAGAHMTDEDRLVHCLIQNRDQLASIGTDVPDPNVYRKLLRNILNEAKASSITAETRKSVLDAIHHDPGNNRLVLSNYAFFGTPKMAVGQGQFYPAAESRIAVLSEIFAGDQLELFLSLRNPATFLPALFDKTPYDTMTDFLNGADPAEFLWSETITRFHASFPNLPMTVWCNEDSPLIWAQVVRELGGLDPATEFTGEFALPQEIMTADGVTRFEAYLKSHPGMTEVQKRRVVEAFLHKFVKEDEIEEEIDIPGWTEEMVNVITDAYDDDVLNIQRVPGVNMITP